MRHFVARTIILVLALVALSISLVQRLYAQTFTVLHTFTGGSDGALPYAGLTMDRAGNLYGTASEGGYLGGNCRFLLLYGCGTVFKLEHRGAGWTFSTIYTFTGPDGANPETRVLFGPDGSLYGTTAVGGTYGFGTVFRLQPPATPCKSISCPWRETVLYSFPGGVEGEMPIYEDLAFDQAGNIYGVFCSGGTYGEGLIYELSPSDSGWTENIIYSFRGYPDSSCPSSVRFDSAGNIYGTGGGGLNDRGSVYELVHSASGWTENILHSFGSDGLEPAGVIFDSAGNLYGTTNGGGNGAGTAFKVTPSNGAWTFTSLYGFSGQEGSIAQPTLDANGNLYGTLFSGSVEVFRLTPLDDQWMLTGFTGSAGFEPAGCVILDASGNLYTTADDVVFEITP